MFEVIEKALAGDVAVIDFGDVKLELDTPATPLGGNLYSPTEFFMAKSTPFIRGYLDIAKGQSIKKVLELGIYKGGSVVFFDRLLDLDQLTAIDLESERLPNLDHYCAHNARANISLHYNVNQADKAKLKDIIATEFPDGIDLVVDDASHFYAPTKVSFETVFPHVKPGGIFAIEDWSWGHSNPEAGVGQEDVTRLLHEIIALHARRADIVQKVTLQPGFFAVTRGWRALPDGLTL